MSPALDANTLIGQTFASCDIETELFESVKSGSSESLKVELFHGERLVKGIRLQVAVWMPYVFSF
jgi:hypothetical protein